MIFIILFTIVFTIGVLLIMPVGHISIMHPMCTTVTLGASLLNFVVSMVLWGEFEAVAGLTSFAQALSHEFMSFIMIHDSMSWFRVPGEFVVNIIQHIQSALSAFTSWCIDSTLYVSSSASEAVQAGKKAMIDPVAQIGGIGKIPVQQITTVVPARQLDPTSAKMIFSASVTAGVSVFMGTLKLGAAGGIPFGGRTAFLGTGVIMGYATFKGVNKYGYDMLSTPVISTVPRITEAKTADILSKAAAFKDDVGSSTASLMDYMQFTASELLGLFHYVFHLTSMTAHTATFTNTFTFIPFITKFIGTVTMCIIYFSKGIVTYFVKFTMLFSGSSLISSQGSFSVVSPLDWVSHDFNMRMPSFITASNEGFYSKLFNNYNNLVYMMATIALFFVVSIMLYYLYKGIVIIANSRYFSNMKSSLSTTRKYIPLSLYDYTSSFFMFVGTYTYKSANIITKALPYFSLYLLLLLVICLIVLVDCRMIPTVNMGVIADKFYKHATQAGLSYPIGDFSITGYMNSKVLAIMLMPAMIYKASSQFSHYGIKGLSKLLGYLFVSILVVTVQMYILFSMVSIQTGALFAGMFTVYYDIVRIMIVASIALLIFVGIFFWKLFRKEIQGHFWNITSDSKFIYAAYYNVSIAFFTLLILQGVVFLATNFVPGDLGSLMDIIVAHEFPN